ncbi:helix-turn-helix transcriptional regulator [Pseudomonas chlororaphis]|uniref:Helix-turn-helix transcriptional regulator n=1 Tax=Pseudomonas chlororaphis TaxID=587753 RepID=A0AB34BZZ2_9PSED|nr:AraC family transcriptional regulator [Pseudomonas chlororaphis]KAA5839269.1 helix-turn-helix transcriptional regulator [Pseudomonas chlororaphis]
MRAVRLLFGKYGGKVHVDGTVQLIPPNSVVVASSEAAPCSTNSDLQYFDFYPADFKHLYADVVDLLGVTHGTLFWRAPIRMVKAQDDVIGVLELLAKGTPDTLLRFAYIYCLGVDRRYFSALLQHIMTGDEPFYEFIETHALNQWSVARYALEFNMPLRKFNLLFQEKYGLSAKRWLLERRLTRARELLLSTPMRVLDIALECGFSNHGHFTESFRKRYLCNPTQYRLRAQATLTPAISHAG